MTSSPGLRRLGALLTILVLTLCGLALPAPTAQADDTVGISIAPVDAKGTNTSGRSRFSYTVDPGQTVTDHVKVNNPGTATEEVTVFAADAYNDDKGEFALKPTTDTSTDAASWTAFEGKPQLKITLAHGESKVVTFTVTVPKNASPGDHAAGVLASATTAGQVAVERRIADRMYVRVSGKLQPSLTISSFSSTYHGGINPLAGTISVAATITNNGNVALEGVTTLTATTWFGLSIGRLNRTDLAEILPGNTATVTYEVTGVAQVGFANVKMLLQSGIGGDAPDPGPLPVFQREAFVPAVPWVVLGVIALGVAVWLLLRWRGRRNARLALEWAEYQKAEAKKNATTESAAGKVDHL
jgi:dihydroorotate dehydrogenase (fumarate)